MDSHTDQRFKNPNSTSTRLCDLGKLLSLKSSSFLYKIAERTTWWKKANEITDARYVVATQKKAIITITKEHEIECHAFYCLLPYSTDSNKTSPIFLFPLHPHFSEHPERNN